MINSVPRETWNARLFELEEDGAVDEALEAWVCWRRTSFRGL